MRLLMHSRHQSTWMREHMSLKGTHILLLRLYIPEQGRVYVMNGEPFSNLCNGTVSFLSCEPVGCIYPGNTSPDAHKGVPRLEWWPWMCTHIPNPLYCLLCMGSKEHHYQPWGMILTSLSYNHSPSLRIPRVGWMKAGLGSAPPKAPETESGEGCLDKYLNDAT